MSHYYIGLPGQSFKEIIEGTSQGFSSEEEIVAHLEATSHPGFECFVVTGSLATLSFYRMVASDAGGLVATRITDSDKSLKLQADKSDGDILFELVTALRSQSSLELSIKSRMTMHAAIEHLGLEPRKRTVAS